MAQATFKDKSFLDVLCSPWTVLPVGLGGSLLIVGWLVKARRELWLFGGVAGLLFGLGVLLTHWLFFAENAARARLRQDVNDRLEAAADAGQRVQVTEAQQRGTPAPAE